MKQEQPTRRRFDGGSILLAVLICCMFGYILAKGGCWTFGVGHWPLGLPLMFDLQIALLLHLALAIYVGFDANRRGMQGFLWGALVLFTSIVGLVVYLIVCSGVFNQTTTLHPSQAPPPPASPGRECTGCHSPVEPEYKVCPYCGEELNRSCADCGKPILSGWKVCPYCGRAAER